MYDEGGEQGCFFGRDEDEDENLGVVPIKFDNPMEESANRYWRASRIWRDKQESTWTTSDMIGELRSIYCYRGLAPCLAERLMEDVIHDRRPNYIAANDTPLTQQTSQ